MTCYRGIVSFYDKIVEDGGTKGKKNISLVPSLFVPSPLVAFVLSFFSSLISMKYFFLIYICCDTNGKFIRNK